MNLESDSWGRCLDKIKSLKKEKAGRMWIWLSSGIREISDILKSDFYERTSE